MKTWKSLLISVVVAFTWLLSGCAPDAVDSFGRPIRMANFHGRWVVINYWATWCVPCIQEIPELNKLAKYYKDKVVVLGVNYDGLGNNVLQNLSQNYQVDYHFLREFPIEKWGAKPPRSLPVTYIIDPKGRLYKTLIGPQKLANFQAVMQLPDITYD